MTPPDQDQVEITVFGPGYGEAIAIHVGSGKWILVDSCLNDEREPASLAYLKEIGVDVSRDVIAVAASHWHDDHIKGLATILEECKSATFSLSAALQKSEFLGFIQAFEDQPVFKLDRGGSEVLKCMQIVSRDRRKVKAIGVDTIIYDCDAGVLSHNQPVELRALSPSGAQFVSFMRRIEQYIFDSQGRAKTRLADPSRNDLSIAMLLTIGDRAMLLGADLEQSSDDQSGWQSVVDLRATRSPKPRAFKVPHHGSENAYSEELMKKVLHENLLSVVTPWRKGGRSLPSEGDRKRITAYSRAAYITSSIPKNPKADYDRDVLKLLRQSQVKIISVSMKCGSVSLRWRPDDEDPVVSLSAGAVSL